MFFFFDDSTVYRDLHSFPTRRSSDLRPYRAARRMSGLRPGRLWMAAGLVCSLAGAAVAEPTLTVVAGGRTAIYTDRKSTRLNSSHMSISYAVFCLKKKIHNEYL